MSKLLDYLILAIVQGTTEWLPVSSSGHLQLARDVLGLQTDVSYDLLLHIATLAALLSIYRNTLWRLALSPFKKEMEKERRLLLNLIIGTAPVAIVGILFGDQIESSFSSPIVVALGFFVTSMILGFFGSGMGTRLMSKEGAFAIGFAQCLALLPGVSRSGTTICAGLATGTNRDDAADFAFLLAIPALLGAFILKSASGELNLSTLGIEAVVGLVLTFGVSLITLTRLKSFVLKHGLKAFAPYTFTLGAIYFVSVI